MKNLVLIIIAVFAFSYGYGQEKSNKKIIETSFHVDGVCKMCKKRIEDATMRVSGVKMAEWDKNEKQLKVVYNNKKTTKEAIQKAVANHGHSAEGYPADSAAYKQLPECCMYNDGVHTH